MGVGDMGKYYVAIRRCCIAVMLGLFAISQLPRPDTSPVYAAALTFQPVYANIRAGMPAADLVKYGFDASREDAESLSYLAVINRYLPATEEEFNELPYAMRMCMEAQDRCTALVFHENERGHEAATTFFIKDNRVAYKTSNSLLSRQLAYNRSEERR